MGQRRVFEVSAANASFGKRWIEGNFLDDTSIQLFF